ncbi:hypothetical protein ACFPJ1_09210 [Kribbella qitaiheensis]|uniref:hypothetical protein n=1 Tax=Kribbella qitaiheensis TaxID=1544730 RepID=UPI003607E5E9
MARRLLSTVDDAIAEARELDATIKSLANSAKATTSEWQSAIDGRAQAMAQAVQLDERVAEVEAEIDAAVRVGLTSSAATLAEEAKALIERVRSDSAAVHEGEAQLTGLEAQVEERRSDLLSSQQESLEARSRFEKAQSAIDLAQEAAERLTRELRLGELLDTDDVVLEHDAEMLLDQLAKAQADVDQQRSELRVADATDEPARIVWDDDPDALLPPHHEVSRARQLLESAGITSEAGWAYLAERSDESVRAELVRRLPHLAGGVLINKPDQLEQAREVLSENGYHSTGTVVVATTQSFDLVVEADFDLSFRSTAGFVAAPNPALYDHEAANADRVRIAKEHLERRTKLTTLDTAYTADRDLSARLITWRAEYPVGTIGQLSDAAASAQTLVQEASDSVDRQGQALQLAIEARDDLREQLGSMRRALAELTEHSRQLTELAHRSRQADGWKQDAGRARVMAEADNTRAQTLFSILEGIRLNIQERQLLAANRRDLAVRAREEIDELPAGGTVDPADPIPVLSVAVLRAVLNDVQRAYDKAEVGDDQLKDLQHAELKANDARAAWEAETDVVRATARQLLASMDGADAASRAAAGAAAASRHKTAAKAHQDAIAKKASYLARLDQLPKPAVVLEPALQPTDPQHGDQLIIEAGRQVSEAEDAHRRCVGGLEAVEDALEKAKATVESFTTIVDTHQAGLDDEPNIEATEAELFTGDRETAQNRYSGLRQSASRAQKTSQEEHRELLQRAERLTRHVIDNRFETLAIPARTQIQGVAMSALADHAAEWSQQLRPRLRSLVDDLAQIGRHRVAILERMSAIVDGALRRLRTAQRLSKLPDGLGDWTGNEFLRIGCSPVEGDLLAHQLGLLLDDVVEHHAKTKKCDGLTVVLRAVRAAVPKGFRVTMLKPDAVLRDERVRISEVRDVFSGGQHLTAAIILYCTLAALRSNDQGKVRHNHSGVLFLDNPIGRASAGYLLDLQRGVAAALGVQLVYTTGLFEEEALAGFPLIIRLRNDADLRVGRKYLSVHERVAPHLGALAPQPILECSPRPGLSFRNGTMTKRTERLADALYQQLLDGAGAWSRTTHKVVSIDEVSRCFGAVFERREGDGGIMATLRACLTVLTERELIVPLKATNLEKVELPQKIKLVPTIAKTQKAVPSMPRWHRSLYYLEDAWPTATDHQRIRYVAINRWLMSDPDTTEVPLRERALEVFSTFGTEDDFEFPEKALDGMRSGPLFGDQERLLRLLRAVATPPPLLSKQPLHEVTHNHLTRVGDGDLLLVVENSATWWSIVHALPARHNVGHVAWGLRASFMSSIRSITDNQEIRRIRYFGDLDLSGLRIPDSARHTARANGLPTVSPAVNLYAELFTIGRSWRAAEKSVDEARARRLTGWLPPEHHDSAARLLTEGRRIAQEWVGYRHLARTTEWHSDLL